LNDTTTVEVDILEPIERKRMVEEIKLLDPNSEVVTIDLDENRISYSSSIIQHRLVTSLSDEELARAYLVLDLIKNYGYKHGRIELERPMTIGKTEIRIDITITVEESPHKPFMIFEAKAHDKFDEEMETAIRNQLFAPAQIIDRDAQNLSYLCYYTSYCSEKKVIERLVVIDNKQNLSFEY